MVVIMDLPLEMGTSEYQMEVFVFHQGRLQQGASVLWSSSDQSATVDANHLLKVTQSGPITLTASLAGKPQISFSVYTTVQLGQATFLGGFSEEAAVRIFPNPANDFIHITGTDVTGVTLYDASGRPVMLKENVHEGESVDISMLPSGVYFVTVNLNHSEHFYKLLKE